MKAMDTTEVRNRAAELANSLHKHGGELCDILRLLEIVSALTAERDALRKACQAAYDYLKTAEDPPSLPPCFEQLKAALGEESA